MGRAVAIAVLACGFGAFGAGTLPAQEIFWDGFDEGDLCAWTNAPVTIFQEQEAFDSHTNDTAADAEPVGRCATVRGTIGIPEFFEPPNDPAYYVPDSDWFEIEVSGPVLLRVTISRYTGDSGCASSDFQPEGDFRNKSAYEWFGLTRIGEPAEDPETTTRQIYLPEDGFDYLDAAGTFGTKDIPANNNRWFVIVDDERNYPLDLDKAADPPVGGEGLCYEMRFAVEPVVGQYAIALNESPVLMPADGGVLSYRLEGLANLELAETFAWRSGLFFDTKLYLVRKSGNSLTTLAGNDDGDGALEIDSRIPNTSLTAAPHFVLVDYYSNDETVDVEFPLTLLFPSSLWH